MIMAALGLPVEMALEFFAGRECEIIYTRPPRNPDKQGRARVVRVEEDCGGTVRLTVSPFDDTLEDASHG